MQSIDINEMAFVYMTTEINRDLIDSNPPQLPFDVEDASFEKELTDNSKRSAYQYDAYNDIIQVSFLWHDKYSHFFFCDDPDVATREVNEDWRTIQVFDYEKEVIDAVSAMTHSICTETGDGTPIGGGNIAGWKVTTDIWPMLINRMFKYDCRPPKSLETDITRKWSTVNRLVEVSNIYTQGVGAGMRRIPSLADTLVYWGFDSEYARTDDIRSAICGNPLVAASMVETYLRDMEAAIRQYYGVAKRS
jgi:hypothetical protein